MIQMAITINFDMDGTIADFYSVPNWLDYLEHYDSTPYEIAKPLVNMSALSRKLNQLQRKGHKICIISWLSRSGTPEFNKRVTETKVKWLRKHLASVKFDEITIVPYGTPKENYCHTVEDVLFDDEERNRDNWTGKAYDVENIMEILKNL